LQFFFFQMRLLSFPQIAVIAGDDFARARRGMLFLSRSFAQRGV